MLVSIAALPRTERSGELPEPGQNGSNRIISHSRISHSRTGIVARTRTGEVANQMAIVGDFKKEMSSSSSSFIARKSPPPC